MKNLKEFWNWLPDFLQTLLFLTVISLVLSGIGLLIGKLWEKFNNWSDKDAERRSKAINEANKKYFEEKRRARKKAIEEANQDWIERERRARMKQ